MPLSVVRLQLADAAAIINSSAVVSEQDGKSATFSKWTRGYERATRVRVQDTVLLGNDNRPRGWVGC